MPTPADNGSLFAALGRIPSGIYIVTIGDGEDATGMLASWVQQAGFEPPMLSLAVKEGRPLTERLEGGEPFVINIVATGQTKFLKHFGKGFEPGEPAFEGIELTESSIGVPALAETLALLECRGTGAIEAGDHRVVVAEVTGGKLLNEGEPMTHIRKSGDHY